MQRPIVKSDAYAWSPGSVECVERSARIYDPQAADCDESLEQTREQHRYATELESILAIFAKFSIGYTNFDPAPLGGGTGLRRCGAGLFFLLVAQPQWVDPLGLHFGFLGRLGNIGGDCHRYFRMKHDFHRMQAQILDRPVEDDL